MTRNDAYRQTEKMIENAQLSGATTLNLLGLRLRELPESLGQLTKLQSLVLSSNQLTALPEWLGQLTKLQSLDLSGNQLATLPEWLGQLTKLQSLNLSRNQLTELPVSLGNLTQLQQLRLRKNNLTDLPSSFAGLKLLDELYLSDNPLNPELAAANEQGFEAVKAYLDARENTITLNEAKLILIGEGEVGKSSLLAALRGDHFVENLSTTHGIEIKPVKVTDPESSTKITLNGWDFGGQRVYRPTHQLFFSAPAVYLVVWKPREGPQQGFVREWIQLVKHREPEAKILVVATHGGPKQRQPDIDRQELWDMFGKETVIDFYHVESKPDENNERRGVGKLKDAIAHVASTLPEMGRSVPKRWQEVREALAQSEAAYLPLESVLKLCHEHEMGHDEARVFVTIEHRLGHLIHYEHDPALSDIVVLKPDWLATAISFVLDDNVTRTNNGIVSFAHLGHLWNNPMQESEFRYAPDLHPLFLRLMERFDLSYKVALPTEASDAISFWQQVKGLLNKVAINKGVLSNLHYTSLIGQLVPDTRPDVALEKTWSREVANGDTQQVQICRIVDEKGQSASAEGLFYQLIVRLHKYSLGRVHYNDSLHWQRGLILDDDYNGRALLEHIGNDVRITVRAPYPERFLAMLTSEVKYLVESFWEGLRCDVMVPCVEPCGKDNPGTGLFEVEKLIAFRRQGLTMFPCMVSGCNQAQMIDNLLRNAPVIRPVAAEELFSGYTEVKQELVAVRQLLAQHDNKALGRFDRLDISTQRILSRVDDAFDNLVSVFTDEAKEGPRLFSLVPLNRKKFDPKEWTSAKFQLTLWCEHSRLPLPHLDGKKSKKGVYEIKLTRKWFKKAAPVLKVITGTLSLVLPVVSSGIKLALDDAAYKAIDEQLSFGKDIIDASLSGSEKISDWLGEDSVTDLEHGEAIRAHSANLRELQALVKAKDPGFGGLVRVMNKRQEFLWVHERFAGEY